MKMTRLILPSGALALMLGLLVIFTAGCGSDTNPDYVEPDGEYHAFGDLENHGSYLVENGYNFSECVACHGTTDEAGYTHLGGQASGVNGTFIRSCYRCHNGETHLVLFETTMQHTQAVRDNNWSFDDCMVCHTSGTVVSGIEFGGSCSSLECHTGNVGPNACNTCHGDFMADVDDPAGWAPPEGIWAESVTDPGIGVHQAHLNPTSGWFEPMACGSCHIVPVRLDDTGHLDTQTPNSAEVNLRGLASIGSGIPRYNPANATCSSVYCHGDATPVWTDQSGTSGACGSCHGLPPAAPHPQSNSCADCHSEVIDASGNIIAPALHLNGVVDVQVP